MLHARDFEPAVHRLRAAGVPPTFPRLAVAKLLLEQGEGRSVDELVDCAHEAGLPVAAADVAAALADLRRAGLVQGEERPAEPGAAQARAASAVLKAMANPWRLRVLCLLAEHERSVGEMEDRLGLSQSTLSQHLARLRQSGLVEAQRRRQQHIYVLAEGARPVVVQILGLLRGLCSA